MPAPILGVFLRGPRAARPPQDDEQSLELPCQASRCGKSAPSSPSAKKGRSRAPPSARTRPNRASRSTSPRSNARSASSCSNARRAASRLRRPDCATTRAASRRSDDWRAPTRRRARVAGIVTGDLRIGLMPTFTRAVLAPTLDDFVPRHPEVRLHVFEGYSGVLTDMVLADELDFAVVPAFEGRSGSSRGSSCATAKCCCPAASAASPRSRRCGSPTATAEDRGARAGQRPPPQSRNLFPRPTASRLPLCWKWTP